MLTASGSSSSSPVGASVARLDVISAQPCSRSSGTGPDHERSVYAGWARAASSASRCSSPSSIGSRSSRCTSERASSKPDARAKQGPVPQSPVDPAA